jgi:DNA-binding LacI/PurR family transcriptional regulator
MPITRKKPLRSNARALSLSDELRALAYKKGPEAKLPTVRQICASYETSRATVNVALDRLEAQNVVYRRQGSGIYVSPTIHHKTCAILLDSSFFRQPGVSPFWGMLWGYLADRAMKRAERFQEEHRFYLVTTEGPGAGRFPDDLVRAVDSGIIDAMIAVGLSGDSADFLIDREMPVVSFAGSGLWLIEIDMVEAIRVGVASLYDQGCRRIAFWAPLPLLRPAVPYVSHAPDNMTVFRTELAKYGLEYDPRLMWEQSSKIHGPNTDTHQEQGHRAVREIFGDPSLAPPDGIMISDDIMTCGVLYGLDKMGVHFGRDVKIATHANVGSSTLYGYSDEMTLIENDPAAIVRALFDTMDIVLAGGEPEERHLRMKPTVRYPKE